MKLSEILGWPDKQKEYFGVNTVQAGEAFGHNTALTSCDREVDEEALAEALLQFRQAHPIDDVNKVISNFISTMPTWLKRSEK